MDKRLIRNLPDRIVIEVIPEIRGRSIVPPSYDVDIKVLDTVVTSKGEMKCKYKHFAGTVEADAIKELADKVTPYKGQDKFSLRDSKEVS
jgi:hypothetical protein